MAPFRSPAAIAASIASELSANSKEFCQAASEALSGQHRISVRQSALHHSIDGADQPPHVGPRRFGSGLLHHAARRIHPVSSKTEAVAPRCTDLKPVPGSPSRQECAPRAVRCSDLPRRVEPVDQVGLRLPSLSMHAPRPPRVVPRDWADPARGPSRFLRCCSRQK